MRVTEFFQVLPPLILETIHVEQLARALDEIAA